MTGLLVQMDAELLSDLFLQQHLQKPPHTDKGTAVSALKENAGIPRSDKQFLVMPVLCTNCGAFRLLRDVLGLTGDWGEACTRCDQLYWDKEFTAALMTLLRIDWRHAFDAIVAKQGNMLARPMLKPMYQEVKAPETDMSVVDWMSTKIIFPNRRAP